EAEAVIAALQDVALQLSGRERIPAVRTAVEQSDGSAVFGAKEHHRHVRNAAREERVRDLIAPGTDVPGVLHDRVAGRGLGDNVGGAFDGPHGAVVFPVILSMLIFRPRTSHPSVNGALALD